MNNYGTFSVKVLNSETVQAIAYSQETRTLAVTFFDSPGRFYHDVDPELFRRLAHRETQALDVWNALDPEHGFTEMSKSDRLALIKGYC